MGCTWTRQDMSLEEMCLENKEKQLGYHRNNVSNIDIIFRKYSYLGKLNKKQLTQAASKLDLNILNSRGHMKIYEFYNAFKLSDEYDLNMLLVTGILLGEGSADTKAKLLWEVYDINGSDELGKDGLYEMLEDMFNIALDRISFLVSDSPICSEYKVKSYVSNCNSVRCRIIDKVLIQLLGKLNSVKKGQFVAKMSKIDNGNMLNSKGIRNIMYEEYSKVPYAEPKKFTTPYAESLIKITRLNSVIPEEEEVSDNE